MQHSIREDHDSAGIDGAGRSRAVVVTGAANGIGAAAAVALATRGNALVLVDRDEAALDPVATRCRQLGAPAASYVADVRVPESARTIYDLTVDLFGGVDDLLLFAGTIHSGYAATSRPEDLTAVIDTNLSATIRYVTEGIAYLTDTGTTPRILTIASAIEAIPYPGYAAYGASKAGVRAFSAAVRNELRAQQSPIHLSCGIVGGVDTNIVARGTASQSSQLHEHQRRFTHHVARTSTDHAARTLLRGLDKKKRTIRVGHDAYLAEMLRRTIGIDWQIPGRFHTPEVSHD